jgi:hypothetical protein
VLPEANEDKISRALRRCFARVIRPEAEGARKHGPEFSPGLSLAKPRVYPGLVKNKRIALHKAHECAFEEKHPVLRVGDAEGARDAHASQFKGLEYLFIVMFHSSSSFVLVRLLGGTITS